MSLMNWILRYIKSYLFLPKLSFRQAREIEQRYLRRQQRRAELEAKKRDREDEKAAEREQEIGRKEEVTVGGCLHYSPLISIALS